MALKQGCKTDEMENKEEDLQGSHGLIQYDLFRAGRSDLQLHVPTWAFPLNIQVFTESSYHQLHEIKSAPFSNKLPSHMLEKNKSGVDGGGGGRLRGFMILAPDFKIH